MKTIEQLVALVKTKKVRKCYSIHHCFLCQKHIYLGESYHDGGDRLRAHVWCAEDGIKKEVGK